MEQGPDPLVLKHLFYKLKASITDFYSVNRHLDENGTLDLKGILRQCDKMECLVENDYETLNIMEEEDALKDLDLTKEPEPEVTLEEAYKKVLIRRHGLSDTLDPQEVSNTISTSWSHSSGRMIMENDESYYETTKGETEAVIPQEEIIRGLELYSENPRWHTWRSWISLK